MLEKATVVLNLVAAITMMVTAIYVVTVFSTVISPSVKVLIGMVVMVYAFKQIDLSSNRANKN